MLGSQRETEIKKIIENSFCNELFLGGDSFKRVGLSEDEAKKIQILAEINGYSATKLGPSLEHDPYESNSLYAVQISRREENA